MKRLKYPYYLLPSAVVPSDITSLEYAYQVRYIALLNSCLYTAIPTGTERDDRRNLRI